MALDTYGGIRFDDVFEGTFEEVYEQQYERFQGTLQKFDLISPETEKVVVAMSGGKDCQLMTTFLWEYKRRERPDLELELITVPLPEWKYFPSKFLDGCEDAAQREVLEEQQRLLDRNARYWAGRGITIKNVARMPHIDDDKIMESSNPCTWCYIATKQAFFKYLNEQEKDVRFAIGLTKWDSVYVMISQMLTSQPWDVAKVSDPKMYDMNRLHLASFSPYPKLDLGLPDKTVYQIQPLVEFNDFQTKALASKMDFPLVPDICQDLHGPRFQSDKRHFDRFLKTTVVEALNIDSLDNPLFASYEQLLKMFDSTGVLPPQEELNNVLYRGYYDEVMAAVIHDER